MPGSCPGVELFQRLGCRPPQGPHLGTVVLVVDLAGSMVELQLFQRCERAVAFLDKTETTARRLVEREELVVRRRRLTQERARDERDDEQREGAAEDERNRHAAAAA
jgi:hypothetical protein